MKLKKSLIYVCTAVAAYFIICNVVIYIYAQQKPMPAADTMVILGAQVRGTPAVPHATLQSRLDVAIVYLKNNLNTKVIVCGGQGADESATEASVMANYLINHGIDSSRIYLEDKSTRTAQQFVYANTILKLGKTVVVTNDFHLLRAMMLAKRSGLNDISGLAGGVDFDNKDKFRALWREPLALINSWLFDHPMDYAEADTQS